MVSARLPDKRNYRGLISLAAHSPVKQVQFYKRKEEGELFGLICIKKD